MTLLRSVKDREWLKFFENSKGHTAVKVGTDEIAPELILSTVPQVVLPTSDFNKVVKSEITNGFRYTYFKDSTNQFNIDITNINSNWTWTIQSFVAASFVIALESGDSLTLETNDKILLEDN